MGVKFKYKEVKFKDNNLCKQMKNLRRNSSIKNQLCWEGKRKMQKHIQYCNSSKSLLGYISYLPIGINCFSITPINIITGILLAQWRNNFPIFNDYSVEIINRKT